MKDKQIIIDGVNVAGCEYFNRFRNICHNKNLCCDCEKNQDCYYKQLQREKQNSQETRDTAIKEFNRAEELKTLLKRKEQEYKELKKQVNDLLNKPEIQDKILWKIDNEAFLGSKDAWIYKLEQTLDEVNDIMDTIVNGHHFTDDIEGHLKELAKTAIQKIREVTK